MSVLDCLLMLLVDCVLYFFLAIYLDQVVPGEFGRIKSQFFCFKLFKRGKNKNKINLIASNDQSSDNEPVGDELKNQVALK